MLPSLRSDSVGLASVGNVHHDAVGGQNDAVCQTLLLRSAGSPNAMGPRARPTFSPVFWLELGCRSRRATARSPAVQVQDSHKSFLAATDVVNGSAQYVAPSPPSLGKQLCFRPVQRRTEACIYGVHAKEPHLHAAEVALVLVARTERLRRRWRMGSLSRRRLCLLVRFCLGVNISAGSGPEGVRHSCHGKHQRVEHSWLRIVRVTASRRQLS